MYLCVRGNDFSSFYDISIGFWKCSDIVVFLGFSFINRTSWLLSYTVLMLYKLAIFCTKFSKKYNRPADKKKIYITVIAATQLIDFFLSLSDKQR
jgi:hypothetical protein